MTTDKVQVGDSTTGTSTSTSYTINSKPQAERGWECPRCGRINAPWKSQCDCAGNTYWYPSWNWDKPYYEEWWKHVYCDSDTFKVHPETTTWKAPSSVCSSDSTTCKTNGITTAWSGNSDIYASGGSDYQNSVTRNWENVPKTYTNQVDNMMNRIDHVTTTTTYYNTGEQNNAL